MGINLENEKTCSFFGHRWVWNRREVEERLIIEIKKLINGGVKTFLVGTHGEFDELVLRVLRELKKMYCDIKIVVVFSSQTALKKDKNGYSKAEYYADVETIMYDIETEHYKRQITKTNQCMIDESDIVVCYVDMDLSPSGAKTALKYAEKTNKMVINVY